MPTIRSCLEHRHCYVRRNAVMAIYTIYKYETVVSSRKCIYWGGGSPPRHCIEGVYPIAIAANDRSRALIFLLNSSLKMYVSLVQLDYVSWCYENDIFVVLHNQKRHRLVASCQFNRLVTTCQQLATNL